MLMLNSIISLFFSSFFRTLFINILYFLRPQPVMNDDNDSNAVKKNGVYTNGHLANGIVNGHASKKNGIANGSSGIRSRKVQ